MADAKDDLRLYVTTTPNQARRRAWAVGRGAKRPQATLSLPVSCGRVSPSRLGRAAERNRRGGRTPRRWRRARCRSWASTCGSTVCPPPPPALAFLCARRTAFEPGRDLTAATADPTEAAGAPLNRSDGKEQGKEGRRGGSGR